MTRTGDSGHYRAALLHELSRRGMAARREVGCQVRYRGALVGQFWADVVVNRLVILELKAAKAIDPMHVVQLINYLRAARLEVGLLLNFGRRAEFERVVATRGATDVHASVRPQTFRQYPPTPIP